MGKGSGGGESRTRRTGRREMRRYFKADDNAKGENWIIAWFGRDSETNKDFNVTTDHVHGSELSIISNGAGGDARLVADLLNWYYNTLSAPKTINAFVKKLEKSK